MAGLTRLCVDLDDADIFLTHMYADHISLLTLLSPLGGSRVVIGGPDREFLRLWTGWESISRIAAAHGLPVDELRESSRTNPFLKFETGNFPARGLSGHVSEIALFLPCEAELRNFTYVSSCRPLPQPRGRC